MDDSPSGARITLAFALAALASAAAAALVVAVISWPTVSVPMAVSTLMVGFPIAVAHAILLAMPAYALLSRRWRLRAWNAALGGFVVGAVPIGLLSVSADVAAVTGGFGAAGGLAFWLLLRRTVASPGL